MCPCLPYLTRKWEVQHKAERKKLLAHCESRKPVIRENNKRQLASRSKSTFPCGEQKPIMVDLAIWHSTVSSWCLRRSSFSNQKPPSTLRTQRPSWVGKNMTLALSSPRWQGSFMELVWQTFGLRRRIYFTRLHKRTCFLHGMIWDPGTELWNGGKHTVITLNMKGPCVPWRLMEFIFLNKVQTWPEFFITVQLPAILSIPSALQWRQTLNSLQQCHFGNEQISPKPVWWKQSSVFANRTALCVWTLNCRKKRLI